MSAVSYFAVMCLNLVAGIPWHLISALAGAAIILVNAAVIQKDK